MKILRIIAASAFCIALALAPAGCKGGSSSSDSSSNSGSGAAPSPGTGFVVLPSDPPSDNASTGQSFLQSIQLFDANGTALSTPTMQTFVYNGVGDIDASALNTDGTHGIFADSYSNYLFYFSVQNGYAQPTTGVKAVHLDTTQYGTDEDSIVLMKNGDEAVLSTDYSGTLLLLSGIATNNAKPAEYIFTSANPDGTPSYRDGVALSSDNTVMLARGQHGLDIFAVNSIAPQPGPIVGSNNISHSFTWITDVPSLAETWADGSGRDGMDFSPTDSSRAVIITNAANGNPSTISLLINLPNAPIVNSTASINQNVYCVATMGDLAVVGTDSGLVLFSGVSSGSLTQVSTMSSYTLPNGSPVNLGEITTLRFTPNGNYVIAGDFTNGNIYTIPVNSGPALGSPAGVLGGVSVPYSDEMMIH